MRLGAENDSAQVTKLQTFLKTSEGLDVGVNGTFDQKTEAAVEAFQTKYMSDIMGPWGSSKASGTVYLTTVKKVNQLACNAPLTLTAAELSTIDAYKNGGAPAASAPAAGPVGVNAAPSTDAGTSPSPVVGPTLGQASGNANVAAAGQASIIQRFWNFLKSIF